LELDGDPELVTERSPRLSAYFHCIRRPLFSGQSGFPAGVRRAAAVSIATSYNRQRNLRDFADQYPARLRMNVLRTHGVDPADFELWCTAVSAINGCGLCVDSHEQVLRSKGVPEESILASVRLASVIHGLATVFDA
jgi:AhpD family alkylhydroperoxidase